MNMVFTRQIDGLATVMVTTMQRPMVRWQEKNG